ncbi:hypothetical protein ONE63_006983 [Megalurothrips usitatus]|uniref:Transcription factor Adf-1-like n=1 Tax=Megalurothrips usitatus TaxID=439358 RepID=A0AAV7XTW7_9NEOP|nr:hypothetical protein ONE63_006983 [Megalurothrips usitatus]
MMDDDHVAAAVDATAAAELPYSDELLVGLVHARENLYDKGRVDYKDEQAKAEAWEAIGRTFGMRAEECQTRWVRLRERFGRELRLHKRGVPPGKEWPLFSRMHWLERFIQPRKYVPAGSASGSALASPSDSGDGLGDEAPPTPTPSSAGPLWPHTFRLWAAGDHHLTHGGSIVEDDMDDSQQEMAVDLATHGSHASRASTPKQAGTPTSGDAGDAPPPGMLPGPLPSPHHAVDFQESVRQSLTAMAGSLDGIERSLSLSRLQDDAYDPDELFARSLAATLRRLPRPRRCEAKMKLIAVMAEFEDGS